RPPPEARRRSRVRAEVGAVVASIAVYTHGGRGAEEVASPGTPPAETPETGGRRAERLRARRGTTRAVPSKQGERDWLAPVAPEVVAAGRLCGPGRIAGLRG